jgi:hypothetical protein
VYFGVAKIIFDWDANTTSDQREMHNLVESVRKKFKVAALSIQDSQGIPVGVAITALAYDENELNKKIDAMTEHCENFGIGRVSWDRALVDHIDVVDGD